VDSGRSGDLHKLLSDGAASLGLALSASKVARLLDFAAAVLEENRKVKITGAREISTVINDHVLDSLALLPIFRRYGRPQGGRLRLVDIGSGAGFPALPLAVAAEELEVVCIEATGKKASILARLGEKFALGQVEVVNERAETAARRPSLRARADFATARGVSRLVTTCELALPFLRVGGLFLAQKGTDPAAEIRRAEGALELLGGKIREVVPVGRGRGDAPRRTVVVIEKVAPTPERFPRRAGIPAKRPLKGGER